MTIGKGRYSLLQELGRGAAGAIWAAWDTQLERRVAIKRLHADAGDTPAALSQFEREARAVAQLRSAHIVQVYDVGADEGRPFMVMELLEGESLESRLCRHGRLPLSPAISIVTDVARGLSVTHRSGILHGDVKPANVFLARESGREVAKLLDFGVATLLARGSTEPSPDGVQHHWLGTPQYMSPEQISGESVDERSDLWSLAVLAYRVLTGQCPFTGATMLALRHQICSASFRPPCSLERGLDPRTDAFFQRAFARQPAARFQTSEELGAEFRALGERPTVTRVLFLDDEPDMELLLRQRFRRQLRDGLYELHFARDGREGLEHLRRRPDIDVVLTDLNMPGMDGMTFLGHAAEVNPFVRVVVVTAYGDMANIRAAMNRGAFDFLSKPIDFDDLQTTIANCAAHVASVRKALQSNEENQVMRALLGQGIAERWLSSLLMSEAAPDGAIRATVAFIDVHGFARTLVPPFPERVFERLNASFAIFASEVLAQGGRVTRFVGDAMLAVWEEHGHMQRAISACLAIRSRLGAAVGEATSFAGGVSMGLHSGEVLTGASGSLGMGRVEPALLGETISIAARLLALALRDELLISSEALDLVACDYQCSEDTERVLVTSRGSFHVARVLRRRSPPPSERPLLEETAPLSFAEGAERPPSCAGPQRSADSPDGPDCGSMPGLEPSPHRDPRG